ncbi:MAG: glucosaminidase domain-containing protein [Synergistaceae bacterium]|nr:glucosaminidase domain-containing protein [Synergistaceae bacterium]
MAKKHKSVNPFGAAVHCAHETGDWKSRLWTEGRNGAGIKANKAWKTTGRPCIDIRSEEHINGKRVMVVSSFRKYRSVKAFLKDYSRKIRDDYPLSAKYNNNVWGYFGGLYRGRHGKWATDHRYFEKLAAKAVKLAPEIYGSKWKKTLTRQLKTAKGFNILEPWQVKAIEKSLGAAR